MNQTRTQHIADIATRLDQAFATVKRADFLPSQYKNIAHVNSPISIGHNQTNSQPSTVYKMLKWLDPQPGQRVLDVGSGSGWTTALVAYLVGEDGYVHAVERIHELVKFGVDNCRKAGITNVSFHNANRRKLGLAKQGPYDRILVSATAQDVPQELIQQLVIGGRMVIPIRNSIYILRKTGPDSYYTVEEPGYAFVPLVQENTEDEPYRLEALSDK